MQRNIDDITKEAIELPKSDRLKLVKTLLFLDGQTKDGNDY